MVISKELFLSSIVNYLQDEIDELSENDLKVVSEFELLYKELQECNDLDIKRFRLSQYIDSMCDNLINSVTLSISALAIINSVSFKDDFYLYILQVLEL